MTYVEALNVAIENLDGEVAEKLMALREQVAKKRSSSKPTKAQVANEAVKAEIANVLNDEGKTVTEITKVLGGDYTPQKISALLRQMVLGGTAHKETVKGKSLFTAVAE